MMQTVRSDGFRPSVLRTYLYTGLFCVAIALMLWLLDTTQSLEPIALVSFCIGPSIATAFLLLERHLVRFMSPYLALLPITFIGLSFGLLLGGALLGNPLLFFTEGRDTWVLGVFFGVIGFLLMGTHGRVLALRAGLARAESERLQQEKLRLTTDLRLLQAQIEPHFLFNTLSQVAGMIHEAPDQAEATLNDLTTLLRASLRRTRSPFTTLGQELEMVRAYLEIHRIRMGKRLSYHIDVPEALHPLSLPPLLLQPLVENAVGHGLEPLEAGGRLEIEARRRDDRLIIRVSDTGRGLTRDPSELIAGHDAGTGIANVLGRLSGLYRGRATLDFTDSEPQGVTAVLELPLEAHDHCAAD